MMGMGWASPTIIVLSLAIYLVGSVAIGLYFGRRGGTSEEGYFVANRDLGMVPLAFSILATIMSGAVFTGTVGLFYGFGVPFIGYTIAFATFLPLTYWVVGRRLWPIAKRNHYVTMQGFFGDYYGSNVLRLGGAIVAIIFLVPYFAVGSVALGIVLERTVGVPYHYGVWLMMAGTLLYSLYGGMSAVSYTDVYQGVIAVVFGIAAVLALVSAAGGLGAIAGELPTEMTTLQGTSSEALYLFYGWLLFMGFSHINHPDRMTRIMAARDLFQLRRGAMLLGILLPIVATIFLLLGLSTALLLPGLENSDEALPTAISQYAPVLIPLLVVTIWATGMSTIDSGLVSATTIFTRDIVQQYMPGPAGRERRVLLLSRAVLLVMALTAIWIAGTEPPFIWDLVGLFNSIALQYFPALIAGLYWRGVTKAGAEAGFIFGVGAVLLMEYVLPIELPPGIFSGMIVVFLNGLVTVVVSLMTKPLPAAHMDSYQELYTGSRSVAGGS